MSTGSTGVPAGSQTSQPHFSRKGLMASAFAGMFVFGIVMAVLGAILPSLFDRIHLSKGEAGNLFFAMNLAMLIMSLVFGPFVDRFGFKSLLLASAVLVAFSFVVYVQAASYTVLLLAAVILGFGGGGLNGGTNALVSDINPRNRSSALNMLGIFFGFGALLIPFLIGLLLSRLGLNTILILAVCLSLVPFFFFLVLSFPGPKHGRGFPIKEARQVVRHPLLWLFGFLLFFQSGNEFTVGGWLSTYLHEHFALASSGSALILAAYWGAIMLGRLVSSRILKSVDGGRFLLGSAGLALAASLITALSPSGTTASVGAVLIGFGFAAIYPTTLAAAGETFARFTGTAFSVIFVIALCGGMLSPWAVGRIAQVRDIRSGMIVPVFNCLMIVLIQLVILRSRRRKTSDLTNG